MRIGTYRLRETVTRAARFFSITEVGRSTALIFLFCALFSTGMASIMYEVVLISFATTLIGITEFSAGIVIGGFLGGLGLGALVGGWYTRRRLPLLMLLIVVEVLIALYGFFFFEIAEVFGIYASSKLPKLFFILGSLLFPSFLMGCELPVAVQWLTEKDTSCSGLHVGIVYAGDTLGGVLGAITAGMIFIPLLGLEGTMVAGGILNAATVFLLFALAGTRNVVIGVLLALCVLFGGSGVLLRSHNYFTQADLWFFRLATQLDPIETAHSPFQYSAIIDHPQFGRSLYFDNILFKGTGSRALHEFSAIPALNAHPNATRVLVLGGGDGGMLYQLVRADIPHIVHVDIDERLVELSRKYLQGVHGGVFDDPRIERHIVDARAFLQETDQEFDIIIFDIPPPLKAELNHVWTKEFYTLVQSRLTPGGLFVVHLPSNQNLEAQAVILATIRSVFLYAYRYEHPNMGINIMQAKIIASDSYDPRVIRRKKTIEGDHWYESSQQAQLFYMTPFTRSFFESHGDLISTDRNPILFQFLQPQYTYKAIRELEYETPLPALGKQ